MLWRDITVNYSVTNNFRTNQTQQIKQENEEAKYFRLRLSDELSWERPESDLRETEADLKEKMKMKTGRHCDFLTPVGAKNEIILESYPQYYLDCLITVSLESR